MARGTVNKVILIGRLGREPELRYTQNGLAVCKLSLATDESYKDKQTQQLVEKTEWHFIEAFDKSAERMGEFLQKGSKVYVEGKLKTEEYEKDGIKRYTTKILAREWYVLDGMKQRQQSAPAQSNQPPAPFPQQAQSQDPVAAGFNDFDDDIPFMRLQAEYLR